MVLELNLILGPMFAGKSTYLINKVNEILSSGISESEILLINHSSDVRYDTNKICSHNGNKINAISLTILYDTITTIINNNFNNSCSNKTYKIQYIFIDEGQFFNDLHQSITTLLQSFAKLDYILNLHIYIFGLDGDFKQKPFNNSRLLELIPYATNILKLNAKCFKCNNIAPFTKRIINSNDTILIGGAEDYQPTCLLHLH